MKVYNYVIISICLAMLFELAGMPIAESLLETIGFSSSSSTFEGTAFWTVVLTLGAALVGGIAISYFTKSSSENYVIWTAASIYFFAFIAPFAGILLHAQTYATGDLEWIWYIILFLMSALMVGFAVSLIEFLRGTD